MPSKNAGFRVFTKIPRIDAAIVEALGKLETPYLSDAMNRFGGMDANLRPACAGMRLAGPAITVRVPPGDNLMVYKAFADRSTGRCAGHRSARLHVGGAMGRHHQSHGEEA